MKLPSIVFVASEAKRAATRFPLALIAATVAACSAVVLVGGNRDGDTLSRLVMVSQLGIPLFIALALAAERGARLAAPVFRISLQLAGVACLTVYFSTLPTDVDFTATARFFQFNVAAHLLVAFLPFLRSAETNGFWQYNKTLFLRLLSGAVFSATLFAGLAVAVLALDQLFGVPVPEETYPRLWIIVAFVFNTWYFVAGIPVDFRDLDRRTDYPAVLRIFAQYILAPLVAVYLSILLAYLVKVLVTTQWPSGWIGYLVSSVAAAGLFSLVLLHPLVEQAGNRWIATYARYFYVLLLPAVFMLLMAIYKRVEQYGVTENRYFLTVFAFWLIFICVHGLVVRKRTIKIIPLSLCLVALLTSFGPWGAYAASRSSQTRRLTGLLEKNSLIAANRLVPARGEISFEDSKEISAGFDYLIGRHGLEAVSPWFDDSLSKSVAELTDSLGAGSQYRGGGEISRAVLKHLGVEYVAKWENKDQRGPGWHSFSLAAEGKTVDIRGFDVAYVLDIPTWDHDGFTVGGAVYHVELGNEGSELKIVSDGEEVVKLDLSVLMENLLGFSDGPLETTEVPAEAMTDEAAGENLRVRLLVLEINWWERDSDFVIDGMKAVVLLDSRS